MDKYKTSEVGKALKRVSRGEMTVRESVKLAENEIAEIFKKGGTEAKPRHTDTGSLGEIVGVCPVCAKNVVRGNTSYGCMGYKDGCQFRIGTNICKRAIPVSEVRRLLATGSSGKISGFISKSGKPFSAKLVIKDGAATLDFS